MITQRLIDDGHIFKALLREREACARIAEELSLKGSEEGESEGSYYAQQVADTIRAQSKDFNLISQRGPDSMVNLRIIKAAVRQGARVWIGTRHSEIIPVVYAETGERVTQDQQGFVADDGNFYNRFQSGAIAFGSGQTPVRYECLLSEHLW